MKLMISFKGWPLLKLMLLVCVGFSSWATADALDADNAWVRAMPPNVNSSAAYVTIYNSTDQPIDIIEVKSDAAEKVQMHEHIMQGDMMQMRQVEAVSIPAEGMFEFVPGGHHIMLMGLTRPLSEGDSVELTFVTKNHGEGHASALVSKSAPLTEEP